MVQYGRHIENLYLLADFDKILHIYCIKNADYDIIKQSATCLLPTTVLREDHFSAPCEGPEVSLPYIFDIFIPKMGEALNIDREVVD